MMRQNRYIPPDHYAMIRRRLDGNTAALCDLLRATGYRVDDVLHTSVGDWSGERVRLRESKTGNIRIVELSPAARSAVARLTAHRPGCGADAPLLPGLRGRPGDAPYIHRTTVWRRFTRAVELVGLSGRGYTIHSLRKMYAVERYNDTMSLMAVQRDLGHRHITTTMWYVCGSDIQL